MSYQFGNRCFGGPSPPPQNQGSMGGYGYGNNANPNYGYGNQGQMNQQQQQQMQMSIGQYGGGNYGMNPASYGGQGQQQQMMSQPQMMPQPQPQGGSPRVSVMQPGQQPDPGMKVIKLNWGDLLGGGGASGTQPLKVAMMGPNGDLNNGNNGLKVTFNGEVPQGMPCHVMNINPYANIFGGQGQ